MRIPLVTAAALLIAASAAPARAQNCDPPVALIALDLSGSMTVNNKWAAAKAAINSTAAKYQAKAKIGLQLFPTDKQCDANTTTPVIAVPPALNGASTISTALAKSTPNGKTPLIKTLQLSRAYLKTAAFAGARRHVLLITDGKETCTTSNILQKLENVAKGLVGDGAKLHVFGYGDFIDAAELSTLALHGGSPTKTPCAPKTDTCYHAAVKNAQLAPLLDKVIASILTSASQEVCDGKDNDCDGKVDEGLSCDAGPGDGSPTTEGGGGGDGPPAAEGGAGADSAGADSAGSADVARLDGPGGDGAVAAPGEDDGCSCRLGGRPASPNALVFAALGLMVLLRRRRGGGAR